MYDRFGDPRYFVSYNGGNPMTVAWTNLCIESNDILNTISILNYVV